MKSLLDKIEKGNLKMKTDAQGTEYPRMLFLRDHFRPGQGHETLDGNLIVSNVVLRSSWIFALVDSGYEIEVNVYRKWVGHNTLLEVDETWFSVSVYHPVWDELMEEVTDVAGEHGWDSELDALFPRGAGEEEGFLRFLKKIKEIRQYLN